jgi:hypothetical protein
MFVVVTYSLMLDCTKVASSASWLSASQVAKEAHCKEK